MMYPVLFRSGSAYYLKNQKCFYSFIISDRHKNTTNNCIEMLFFVNEPGSDIKTEKYQFY